MITKQVVNNVSVSISDLFSVNTNEFLRSFEGKVKYDVINGSDLNFEIQNRYNSKFSPIIKLATLKDAHELVEIYKNIYDGCYPYKEMEDVQEIKRMLSNPNIKWFLFKDINDNTAGCITFVLDHKNKRGYIRGFMVTKAYQGKVDTVKAMIASMIIMCNTYKGTILVWYVENRTAHASSQYPMRVCGIAPIAFYPNKDIFFGKVESDLMQVVYDKKALTKLRSEKIPNILPDVLSMFLFSDNRYNLGEYKVQNPQLNLNWKIVARLKNSISTKVEIDNYGYQTFVMTIPGSDSYFKFLYTPNVQNFEKTEYSIKSDEELYAYVQQFRNIGYELDIRYCEVFVSAYNITHQKIFYSSGLRPRGYVPSWKYNEEAGVLEDHILFNYFEGDISEDIQLINEGWELIECLNL